MFNLIIGGIFVAVVIYVLWVKGIVSFKWLTKFKSTKTKVESAMKSDVAPIQKSEIVIDHVNAYATDETRKLLESRANADHLAKSIEQATAAKVTEPKPEVKAPVKTATKTATKTPAKTATKTASKTTKTTSKAPTKKGNKRK